MKSVLFLLIISLLSLFISCKKTPEEKLFGKWKIEAAYVNGIDKTADLDTLQILYYEFKKVDIGSREEYLVDRLFIEIDTSKAQWVDSCSSIGGWTYLGYYINEKRTEIAFGNVHTYSRTATGSCLFNSSFIPAFITVNSKNELWQILKWKRTEFWVEMNANGIHYETHFKRL